MEKETKTKGIMEDYCANACKKTYCFTADGKMVFTTNHDMFKTLLLAEELRKAEAVKQGKPDYDIVPYKHLSVITGNSHYLKFADKFNCSMLYKEGQPGDFANPEHCTLILTNNPEQQVEMVDDVFAGHCAHYHKSTTRGYADTEVPYVTVTGSYEDKVIYPQHFDTRGEILKGPAVIKNGDLYDFVMSSPITDACIDMTTST